MIKQNKPKKLKQNKLNGRFSNIGSYTVEFLRFELQSFGSGYNVVCVI